MKICKEHWDQLKATVIKKGMGHLIAKSGEQLTERLVKQVNNQTTIEDPLAAANFMIWERALKVGGLYMMGQKEDGSLYCPLCELNTHADHNAPELNGQIPSNNWIEGCTDFLLKENKEKGLLNQN